MGYILNSMYFSFNIFCAEVERTEVDSIVCPIIHCMESNTKENALGRCALSESIELDDTVGELNPDLPPETGYRSVCDDEYRYSPLGLVVI